MRFVGPGFPERRLAMTMKPSYLTVDLLKRAKDQVRASVLYKRFIDGNPLQNDIAVWMAEFAGEIRHEHIEHVKDFLNELYAVMVDPCAEGTMSVKDMKAALLAAAIRDRDAVVATQVSSEQRDRIVRWLRECQALLAEPTEVPELEALIATLVAAQASPPTATQCAEGFHVVADVSADPRVCAKCGLRWPNPTAAKMRELASPPTPERELVGEVIRGVRDRLTASGEVEDYDRGVCDACNDSLELLYTGKLTPSASPTPAPQETKP